ncbi:MAG: hypothetical protein MUF38_08015 [Anaerolineae bacterium]|jgi:O-antigen/teichoic acid export membrane protein|nr:hypothetical protein [Anaerolineae bacterium]
MSEQHWQRLFHQSQTDSYARVAVTLLLLNGVQVTDIAALAQADIDLEHGWLTTQTGRTYPLVSYAWDALAALLEAEPIISTTRMEAAASVLTHDETQAHRLLAGAIWVTDETLAMTLETSANSEMPILSLRFTFPFSIADRLQAREISAVSAQARHVLQSAADWLVEQMLTPKVHRLLRVARLLRQGSLVFLLSSTVVNGLNLIHNIFMGRLLSPADYSQLTLIITLQLLIGLFPSALQTVTARFAARYQARDESMLLHRLYQHTGRLGWGIGGAFAVLILLLSPLLVTAFKLDGVWLLLPVIGAIPLFIRTGADRGLLQGIGAYYWMSAVYLGEGIVRLGISVALGYALIEVGRSLEGSIWGLAQSMLVTWFIGWLALRHFVNPVQAAAPSNFQAERRGWLQLGGMTGLVLIGQMLITNSDFLLVKNFFSPEDAGLYAAVSVLGRIVYFGALPLTILLIPLIARRQALNQPTRPILLLIIGGGVIVCGGLVAGAVLFAPDIVRLLYGDAYIAASNLLAPYALAAALYTLTNLVVTYQIALGKGGETWMPILAGALQVIAIILFHESLAQVITIQILLMGLLFILVLWRVLRSHPTLPLLPAPLLESQAR